MKGNFFCTFTLGNVPPTMRAQQLRVESNWDSHLISRLVFEEVQR